MPQHEGATLGCSFMQCRVGKMQQQNKRERRHLRRRTFILFSWTATKGNLLGRLSVMFWHVVVFEMLNKQFWVGEGGGDVLHRRFHWFSETGGEDGNKLVGGRSRY